MTVNEIASATRLRRLLLALLAFGLVATGTDLLLLEHYEDARQMVPLALILAGLLAIGWHLSTGSAASVVALRLLMVAFVAAGAVGGVLHYRGNLEFQLDMDPAIGGWELFSRVMHAKAPPALAPGAMAQLGLLGLILTLGHPALERGRDLSSTTTTTGA